MLLLLQLWKGPLGASFTKISEKENHMVVQSTKDTQIVYWILRSVEPQMVNNLRFSTTKEIKGLSSSSIELLRSPLGSHRTTTSTTATSASFDLCVNVFVGLVAVTSGNVVPISVAAVIEAQRIELTRKWGALIMVVL
ncbi:hypothetical protein HKD37_14G040471 [Glycine soja]